MSHENEHYNPATGQWLSNDPNANPNDYQRNQEAFAQYNRMAEKNHRGTLSSAFNPRPNISHADQEGFRTAYLAARQAGVAPDAAAQQAWDGIGQWQKGFDLTRYAVQAGLGGSLGAAAAGAGAADTGATTAGATAAGGEAAGSTAAATAPGWVDAGGIYGSVGGVPLTAAQAAGAGMTTGGTMAAAGGMTAADWAKLGLAGSSGLAQMIMANKQANSQTALTQQQLAQQQKQFEATLANQQGMQGLAATQMNPLAQQESRQKMALKAALLAHYTPLKYEHGEFTGGDSAALPQAFEDAKAFYSQDAMQNAERGFNDNAATASGGRYVPQTGVGYSGSNPGGPAVNTAMPNDINGDDNPITRLARLRAMLQNAGVA